jgi:hypothetical protein
MKYVQLVLAIKKFIVRYAMVRLRLTLSKMKMLAKIDAKKIATGNVVAKDEIVCSGG